MDYSVFKKYTTLKLKVALRLFAFFCAQLKNKKMVWLKSNSYRNVGNYKAYDLFSCDGLITGVCNDDEKTILQYDSKSSLKSTMTLERFVRGSYEADRDAMDYLFSLFFYQDGNEDGDSERKLHGSLESSLSTSKEKLNRLISDVWQHTTMRFVIGAGLSLVESGYDSSDWSELLSNMKNSLKKINPRIGIEKIDKFFGNQYGIPQVLKGTSKRLYWRTLIESVYKNGSFYNFRKDSNTTLQHIARIISNQIPNNNKQFIATFNFDDNLENEFSLIPGSDAASDYSTSQAVYKNERSIPIRFEHFHKSIIILHTHGYYPRKFYGIEQGVANYKNSIVLTDKDYDTAYTGSAYPRATLKFMFTESCTFVGNSISDYEERKTIKTSFEANHVFHFVLKTKSGDDEFDTYFQKYMLSIGVFVIWFESHESINSMLKGVADRSPFFW